MAGWEEKERCWVILEKCHLLSLAPEEGRGTEVACASWRRRPRVKP